MRSLIGMALAVSSTAACGRTGPEFPDARGSSAECCVGDPDHVATSSITTTGIVIDASELPNELRGCGPNGEAIAAVTLNNVELAECRGRFVFAHLIVALRMDRAVCGGQGGRDVEIKLSDVRYAMTANADVTPPCVTSSEIDYGTRFTTMDPGFATLFATPAGATLMTAILDPYALHIALVGDFDRPEAGPTSCQLAVLTGPGVPAVPPQRTPPRCPM